MNRCFTFYMSVIYCIMVIFGSFAQQRTSSFETNTTRLGFNYGFGTQQSFPFQSEDYVYDTRYMKFLANFKLTEKRKWRLELSIEPSLYRSEHQLLNVNYVQLRFGSDYLYQRKEYSKEKVIHEYALNLGLQFRHVLFEKVSAYLLGGIGPMISDTDTERLKKGFAFSDIAAIGLLINSKSILLDFRVGVRHVSNAGLSFPNGGYNSSSIEVGISFPMKNKNSSYLNKNYGFRNLF